MDVRMISNFIILSKHFYHFLQKHQNQLFDFESQFHPIHIKILKEILVQRALGSYYLILCRENSENPTSQQIEAFTSLLPKVTPRLLYHAFPTLTPRTKSVEFDFRKTAAVTACSVYTSLNSFTQTTNVYLSFGPNLAKKHETLEDFEKEFKYFYYHWTFPGAPIGPFGERSRGRGMPFWKGTYNIEFVSFKKEEDVSCLHVKLYDYAPEADKALIIDAKFNLPLDRTWRESLKQGPHDPLPDPEYEPLPPGFVGMPEIIMCGAPELVSIAATQGEDFCCHGAVKKLVNEIWSSVPIPQQLNECQMRTEITESVSKICMEKGMSESELRIMIAAQISSMITI